MAKLPIQRGAVARSTRKISDTRTLTRSISQDTVGGGASQTGEETNTGRWSQQTETQPREVKRAPRTPKSQGAEHRDSQSPSDGAGKGVVSTGEGDEPAAHGETPHPKPRKEWGANTKQRETWPPFIPSQTRSCSAWCAGSHTSPARSL